MLEWIIIALLLLGGIALLIIEIIFVPGTTVVGIAGGILMTFGIIHTFNTYGSGVGYVVFFASVIVGGLVTIWSFRSRSWERFSLKDVISSRVNDEDEMSLQIGQRGITVSSCRPFGKAEFEDKEWEVKTNGSYLESGRIVQIVKIDNRNIFIEPISE